MPTTDPAEDKLALMSLHARQLEIFDNLTEELDMRAAQIRKVIGLHQPGEGHLCQSCHTPTPCPTLTTLRHLYLSNSEGQPR